MSQKTANTNFNDLLATFRSVTAFGNIRSSEGAALARATSSVASSYRGDLPWR